jgi:hypothetical protein
MILSLAFANIRDSQDKNVISVGYMHPQVKAELVDQDLKKHVAAIHIENRLSLLERKMANVLLLNAYPHLLTREAHRIRIKDLADILGFDSNDRDCLKKALVNLMSTVLTWNIIDQKGNEKVWRARPMLMSADIERNWCIYAYHQDLRHKLFNPDIYSRINLSIQRKFTSGYALALYENCLRYRSIGSTGWWSLDIFRKLLGVEENDYYADFRRLNSKLIKPAVQQVNKTSDIFLEAETKSEKRRVTSIRFLIRENPQISLFAARPELAIPPPDNPEEGASDEAALRQSLHDWGLHDKEITRVLSQYGTAYIRDNVDIVAELQAKGFIKSTPRSILLDALKKDYRTRKTQGEPKSLGSQGENRESTRQAGYREQPDEQLRREFDKYRLEKALNALSAEGRKRLEAEFIAEITEGSHSTYTVLRPIYQRHGLSHAAVQSCFRHFTSNQLLTAPTEQEYRTFLKEHHWL